MLVQVLHLFTDTTEHRGIASFQANHRLALACQSDEFRVDFILRPEITGRLVNVNYYAGTSDGAVPFIDPEILNDRIVYPQTEELQNAEILLPLGPEGEPLYE